MSCEVRLTLVLGISNGKDIQVFPQIIYWSLGNITQSLFITAESVIECKGKIKY